MAKTSKVDTENRNASKSERVGGKAGEAVVGRNATRLSIDVLGDVDLLF